MPRCVNFRLSLYVSLHAMHRWICVYRALPSNAYAGGSQNQSVGFVRPSPGQLYHIGDDEYLNKYVLSSISSLYYKLCTLKRKNTWPVGQQINRQIFLQLIFWYHIIYSTIINSIVTILKNISTWFFFLHVQILGR